MNDWQLDRSSQAAVRRAACGVRRCCVRAFFVLGDAFPRATSICMAMYLIQKTPHAARRTPHVLRGAQR